LGALLFYSYGDTRKHQFFIDMLEDNAAREQAEKKLRWVVDFCELLACRRGFILRYFGEEWGAEECGNCDRCLSEEERFDATEVSQKILSAVVHLNSRFGKNYVIDILRGKESSKMLNWGHNKLSVFGIVKDFSADYLQQIIDSLVALGYLFRSEGKYPILSLTDKGELFLMKREGLMLPKPIARMAKMRTSKAVKTKTVDHNYDDELFQKLRVLRKRIADEKSVPPFIVFGDVSLKAMASSFPRNKKDFLEIHGVGLSKLERFGEQFLDEISDYVDG
jgi:ATP-dependent DNA helicase RecQ